MAASRIYYAILLSAAIQLALGAFTGHPYDERVFLAVGYTVAHGNSPYQATDVSGVFGNSLFPQPVPGTGYPPPWSLLLSLCYLLSYGLTQNLILYNFAVKIPIVVGNILLALLVGRVALSETSDAILSESATCFMLFNPYVIYTTAIWGQFDTVSALLMLIAVFGFARGKWRLSAVGLGSAIALKVIPIVLLPVLIFHIGKRGGRRRAFEYSLYALGVVGLAFAPFLAGWSFKPILDSWNVHFLRVGAFSPLSVLLLFGVSASVNGWEILGYLWLPSLVIVYYVLSKRPMTNLSGLILGSLAIMLAFSLTRSWVSEQNINFVLPFVLLASITQSWSRRWLTATWALPLIFAFLHTCPLQMLFLVAPESVLNAISVAQLQSDVVVVTRILITMIWLAIGLALLKKTIGAHDTQSQAQMSRSAPRFLA